MTNFARSFAKELASDPFVREALSRFCWKRATISSNPTKAGVKEICSDPTHPFFGVHRFVKKPVRSFSEVDSDDGNTGNRVPFLDLINAARDRGGKGGKLVEYTISIDNSSLEKDDQVTLRSSATEFYIGALPDDIYEDQIAGLFQTGEVKRVHVEVNKTGQMEAFVTFTNASAARASVKRDLILNGQQVFLSSAAGKRRAVVVDPNLSDDKCSVLWPGGELEEYSKKMLAPCQPAKTLYKLIQRALMPSVIIIASDLANLGSTDSSQESDPSLQRGW